MISVIIPVRDMVQHLGQALDSVAAQTLPPGEVIVVDNGSSDGSGDLARSRGVTTVYCAQAGAGSARNVGVAHATGELFVFLDADDLLTPDHHEKLSAAIGDDDAAEGYAVNFFDEGRESELSGRFVLSETPLRGVAGATLIRRDALERLGGFGEGPLHDFFGLRQALGEIPHIDDVVLRRRIHGANRSITGRAGIHAEYLHSARAAILKRRQAAE